MNRNAPQKIGKHVVGGENDEGANEEIEEASPNPFRL